VSVPGARLLTRRTVLGIGAGAAASLVVGRAGRARAAAAMATATARKVLYVQPLGGELPAADAALVATAIEGVIGWQVRTLERMPLPAAAFYQPRRRWRAEKLLDVLDGRLPADGTRILGLTGADISTTKGEVFDWGVLGLGRIGGASSVISAFRCRRTARGAAHARERLAKVAVHEVGHTLGLDHCPNRGCLMEDAQGRVATCDREYDFCARCRKLLADASRPLPASPVLPWPRPR
jgi:archaemetzincin